MFLPQSTLVTIHSLQVNSLEDGTWQSNIPPAVSKYQVCNCLRNLNTHRSMGPSEVHLRVLKELVDVVAKTLLIFGKSWWSGEVPGDWKKENIAPIFKKGRKKHPGNYRHVSLTPVTGKIMEQIFLKAIPVREKEAI